MELYWIRHGQTISCLLYTSGMEDLKRKVIRCVGCAVDRFTEDALRILRAIRFAAQLGFEIQEETFEAIKKIAPNMVHVSKERVQTELTKLLLSPNPERIELVYETGISPFVSDAFHKICLLYTSGTYTGGIPYRRFLY